VEETMSNSLLKTSLVLGLAVISAASFAQVNANGTSNTPDSRFTSATGNLNNITISSSRVVKWGKDKRNSLEFMPKTFTTVNSNPFKVGSLQWNNSSYGDQDGSMSVSLNIGLNYGARGAGLMALDLKYTESKYGTDKFALPGAEKYGTAVIDGQTYNVHLAGFKHVSGGGKIDGLKWTNSNCDTIDIYAKLEPCPPVPEPASMAALGLGVVAMIKRRRNRK
jgi:PEP-CTERM motif